MAFAWSCEPEMACYKHPNRNNQPGVCSACLKERLSEIPGAILVSSSASSTPLSSCSPQRGGRDYYYSSGSSSGRLTPRGHRRITSDVVGHFSFVFSAAGGAALKKSRSVAFASNGGGGSGKMKKKKEGFWSKLIRSTGKKTRRVFLL